MKKTTILLFNFLLLLLVVQNVKASHYRAGEITYQLISGRLYQVTVKTYTDPSSSANLFTGTVQISWGDTKSETINRTSFSILASGRVQENIYVAEHAYSSDGNFLVSINDQFRVNGIQNINSGNTDQIAFYVQSLIKVNNAIGNNTSPRLTVKPILEGCADFFYMHNPGAYDLDGDSLVYTLDVPRDGDGLPVPNYETPRYSDSFSLDVHTGSLYWVTPLNVGIYNVAIKISEYRFGILVGYVIRDMQIRINQCANTPPTIPIVSNSCVEAGDSVKFNISSTDINIQTITLRGYGGPFDVPYSPAVISPNPGQGNSIATTRFLWKTDCRHIQFRPYMGTIEAMDNYPGTPMASYASFNVKIIGPRPHNVKTKQIGNGFLVSWQRDTCQLANSYKIYRKIDSSFYNIQQCITGMPSNIGYSLIGQISASLNAQTDTFFYDNNKGDGLSPLINYCYRIVAVFPPRDGNGNYIYSELSESYVSDEVCDAIILSKPIIIKTSVTTTHNLFGAIQLDWVRPDTLDTTIYTPPYRLVFKRATIDKNGVVSLYNPFKSINYTQFYLINDSSLIDSNINTLENEFSYKIELQHDSSSVYTYVDESPPASSVYVNAYGTDNTNILTWNEHVPWLNKAYIIYRKNDLTLLFDSIATVGNKYFIDTSLINGKTYTYRIQSIGRYSFLDSNILNFSQIVKSIPIDTIKPCPPQVFVTPPCNQFNNFTNIVSWIPNDTCSKDVITFNIYYKKLVTDNYELLGSVSNQTFSFLDTRDTLRYSIAGCYVVTGVDSFNNEGLQNNAYCVDNCPYYEIPNVFTPGNNDGKNDLLRPFPYRFINNIDLKIYNRWGQLVYKTTNLDINWDGKTFDTQTDCSEGTYFYVLDVYEQYLTGIKTRNQRGTVKLNR